MTQKEVKGLIQNSQEKPIRVCMTDGATYTLSHPDFAFATSGSLIIASGPGHELNAEFVICPFEQIARIEILKRKLPKAA